MSTGIPKEIWDVINVESFDPILREHIVAWTEESFSLFLYRNKNKIASHLNPGSLEDLRDIILELFVARMFLRSGCQVAYEPKSRKHRGPDFLIEFGTDHFYCEVRRIRESNSLYPAPGVFQGISSREVPYDPPKQFRAIGDIICDKLFQIETGHPNVIYIRSNRSTIHKEYLEKAFNELLEQAHKNSAEFFINNKFRDVADFLKRLTACSAVILDNLWVDSCDDVPAIIQVNPEAKCPLSPAMLAVIKHAVGTPFRFRYIAPLESPDREGRELVKEEATVARMEKKAESPIDTTQSPVGQIGDHDSNASQVRKHSERYPLRGKLLRYLSPFGSVAEGDWEVLK
jgi:hypothetical protein